MGLTMAYHFFCFDPSVPNFTVLLFNVRISFGPKLQQHVMTKAMQQKQQPTSHLVFAHMERLKPGGLVSAIWNIQRGLTMQLKDHQTVDSAYSVAVLSDFFHHLHPHGGDHGPGIHRTQSGRLFLGLWGGIALVTDIPAMG